MMIALIAAAAENNVIGKEGGLPWSLPADLKRFRALTVGHPIIMGSRTHRSIGRALPDRLNIVISRDASLSFEGCETVTSLEAALARARETGTDIAYVIGGGQIYEQAIPIADRIELTRIHAFYDGDVFLPAFSDDEWEKVWSEDHEAEGQYQAYTLERWEKKS